HPAAGDGLRARLHAACDEDRDRQRPDADRQVHPVGELRPPGGDHPGDHGDRRRRRRALGIRPHRTLRHPPTDCGRPRPSVGSTWREHMTTTTDSQAPVASAPTATGRVARVTGAVVDIEFPPGNIPDLYNALTIQIEDTGSGLEASTLTLETAQRLGDGMVRGIALKPTDGAVRGQAVTDTGAPISVPVGDATLGTVFDVIGTPL